MISDRERFMHRLSTAVLGAALCVGFLGNVTSANAQGWVRAVEEAGVVASRSEAAGAVAGDLARLAKTPGFDFSKPITESPTTSKLFNDHLQSEIGPSSLCGGAGLAGGYASDSTTTGLGTYGACRGGVHLYQEHGLTLGQH
jgi:hypothetical protein